MGKRGWRRGKDKKKGDVADKKGAKQDTWDENAPRKPYQSIVKENKDFDAYYKLQGIVPANEWDVFISAIKDYLPTAFRVTGTRKAEARSLLAIIKKEFFKDSNQTATPAEDSEKCIEPVCIPWYPDELAWQMKITRKDIRSSEMYFRLHNFLIAETDCGGISRQETVSMIPPLLLDVHPHHKVLDMCAAPGSKTAQLIELLHAGGGTMPSGFVIANDVDNRRCYMLTHQAKRLNSPCIVVTNHDSAIMPNFNVPNEDGALGVLKFDRILCDVPCSGDGTLRKNPDIWMKWNVANGSNLHGIQARILRRGIEMLTVGGRIVYSTCSLNPVEDEAVIHRLLVESEGAVRLVDITGQLPGLKYNPGVSHWLPASRDPVVGYEKYEDVPEKFHTQIRPMMFPPKPEDAHKYTLERCIRILPHHQDTGGFFVAVLEKLSLLPWESGGKGSEETSTQADGQSGNSSVREPPRKKRRARGFREDPFVFFDETEPIWPSIREFYNISDKLQSTCLLTRCYRGKKKNIYVTSPTVRDIIYHNQDNIKIINTGVKTFVRCDNRSATNAGCSFRLAQEGLPSILPFIGPKRKLSVTKDDLVTLLKNTDLFHPPEIEVLNPKTQEQANDIGQGSCVLVYNSENEPKKEESLSVELVGWRGIRSVRAYVPTSDAVHYLRLCGADVSMFMRNKFKDRVEAPEKNGENDSEAAKDGDKNENIGDGGESSKEVTDGNT